jgi:hypothetical protein
LTVSSLLDPAVSFNRSRPWGFVSRFPVWSLCARSLPPQEAIRSARGQVPDVRLPGWPSPFRSPRLCGSVGPAALPLAALQQPAVSLRSRFSDSCAYSRSASDLAAFRRGTSRSPDFPDGPCFWVAPEGDSRWLSVCSSRQVRPIGGALALP